MGMERASKRPAGSLPLVLACGMLACGLALCSIVSVHSTDSFSGISPPSNWTVTISMGRRAAHAFSSSSQDDDPNGGLESSSSSSSEPSSGQTRSSSSEATEVHAMLQRVQQQLTVLTAELPSTIHKELESFYAAQQGGEQQEGQQLEQDAEQQQEQDQRAEEQPGDVGEQQAEGQQATALAPSPASAVHHIGQARSACDKRSAAGITLDLGDELVAPVVIVAYNRVHYLARALMNVLRHWHSDPTNTRRFPLFVSIDDGEPSSSQFAAALNFGAQVQVIHNMRDAKRCQQKDAYCNLAVHYHMLLELFFKCVKAPRLLLLEEDLDIAPDFFSYFAALAPVLERDPSTMCISAWNDHGQRGRVSNSSALWRTDIFPGLGWMLPANFAAELMDAWPDTYWDELLRKPEVRKGRTCVFPEVPRTHTFGKDGTSHGAFFDTNFKNMALNADDIDWSKKDLSDMDSPVFEKHVAELVAAAQPVNRTCIQQLCDVSLPDHTTQGDMVVRYSDSVDYATLAGQLSPMMTDCKGQPTRPGSPCVPRGSFKGIVSVRCRGRRLFIAPQPGSQAEVKPWSEVSAAASAAAPAAQAS